MKNEENDIENLFKESFTDFEAEVSPSVWENVKTGLKAAGLGVLVRTFFNKIGTNAIVAAVSSIAAVVTTVFIMNTNKAEGSKTQTIIKPAKNSVSEIKTFLAVDNKKITAAKPQIKEETKDALAKVEETTAPINAIKKNKKKIASVINTFSEKPIASITSSPVGGTVPLIVNLVNTGTGKLNKWTYGDGKKGEVEVNPVHVFDVPGVYTVTLTSTNVDGKVATDSIKVEVTGNSSIASIPSSFSPNGDGIEDVFVFQSKNIVSMQVVLFDKKGKVIYTWEGIDGKWEGKNQKGDQAKEGLYFYIISATGVDGKKYEQKGSINLTR